jgi:predicted enzyme related to lactoylglutathione lyase
MSDTQSAEAQIGLLDLMLMRTDDVLAAVAFYRDVLGATVQSQSPQWAQVRLANVDIGIHERGSARADWEPGFRVADIAAFRAHLEAHGVPIAQGYHDIPGGVTLAFTAPGGATIAVYQYGVAVADLTT